MNRWGRIAMYSGIVVVVLGLCKAHAVVHEYTWSGSSRFAWSLGYVLLLSLASYSVGLPEQLRTRRGALLAAVLATGSAALVISSLQLFVGDALLPRFVVLGSGVVLVPWFVLCAALSHDVDARAGERDRVVVVASTDELAMLEADLARAPEKPALIVGCLSPHEVAPHAVSAVTPLVDMVHDRQATVVVLSRQAQSEEEVVVQ
ncbi:MAG TPA: hypothetical protein VFW97_02830, partial [Acidimicrobiia bacterium]|nr:hypothetical protein [Acidimicrobiia bacterium]